MKFRVACNSVAAVCWAMNAAASFAKGEIGWAVCDLAFLAFSVVCVCLDEERAR